jgi:glyoxylase-like metal-dependent hydrolase (beta-lactamase superfamily II)
MPKRLGANLMAVWGLWPLLSSPLVVGQTVPDYEVYAIEYAPAGEVDVSSMLLGAESPVVINGSNMVWLIRDPEGRNILVDTGCLPDNPRISGAAREVYIRPDEALAKLGVAPGDITDIIITHLHWDHADGVSLFPTAQIWIQKAELEYYATSAWQEGGDHRGVDAKNVLELADLNTQGRVTLVEGDDQEIFEGIRVYTGGRHTYAPQYVGVETPDGTVILASDNVWFYANLELNLTNSLTFDSEADEAAQARMKELASRPDWIIPGHDGAVFERFPNPVEGVARIR